MTYKKYHIAKRKFITDVIMIILFGFMLFFGILTMIFGDDEGEFVLTNQQLTVSMIIAISAFIVVVILDWIIIRRHVFYEDGKHFVVEKGLFFKSKVEIPFEHIHTTSLKRNLIHMIIGVSKVQVDTGAIMGVASEANLLVNKHYAKRLKDYLEHKKEDDSLTLPSPYEEGNDREEDEAFYRVKWYQLLLMGIAQTWVLIGLCLLIAASIFFFYLESITNFVDVDVTATWIAILLMAVGIIIVAALYHVIHYYGYELRIDGDAISYQYGLFQRTQFRLHKKRLNAMTLHQPPLYRLMKRYTLEASVIGIQISTGDDGNQSESTYLMPIVKADQLCELLNLLGYEALMEKEVIHPKTYRALNFIYLPLLLELFVMTFFGLMFYEAPGSMLLFSLLFIWVFIWLLFINVLYHKQHGYHLYDDELLIQNGALTLKRTLVKHHRIQAVYYKQGPILLLEKTGRIHIVFKGLAKNRRLLFYNHSHFVQLSQEIFNFKSL